MVNPEKFVIIPSHARTKYNLSGNELIAYGLIYGFSQDEKSWFVGGLQYVADWCGLSSKIRAKEVLQRLIDKGCIRKREIEVDRNIKKCDYQAILPVSEKDSPYLKEQRGVSEKDTVVSQTDTNNIDSSIKGSIVNEDNYSSSRTINSTSNKNNISSTLPKKEKKGLDLSFVSTEYIQAFGEWLNYKRSIKDMYKTQRGVEGAYRDLLAACNNSPADAINVVNYCIDKEYRGIYAPKQLNQQSHGSNNQKPRNRFCDFAETITRAGGIL